MTRDEVKAIMTKVHTFYPRFELASDTLNAWSDMLSTVRPEQANRNLERYISADELGRTPTIAVLLKGSNLNSDVWVDWDYRKTMRLHKIDDITYEDQNGFKWGYPEDVE